MGNSTKTKTRAKTATDKPDKPQADFPLFPHASGQWAKKIKGKLFYFGVWSDPNAALKRFNHEGPYLREGREPPVVDVQDGCELRQLCNEFLRSKKTALDSGDLSGHTYANYYRACETMVDHFGKHRLVSDLRPDDFRTLRAKLSKRYDSPSSLKNEITQIRTVLAFAFANELIDKPVRFGTNFDKPLKRAIRKHRNTGGENVFSREECLTILDYLDGKPVQVPGVDDPVQVKPKPQLRAMALLGLNCGFGNVDIANLPQKAVDLDGGWIEFPRPKTEINRRVPLWPETVEALRVAIETRPKPRDANGHGLCLLTAAGRPWQRSRVKPDGRVAFTDAVPGAVRKVLMALKINGRRRLGFYTFRHCFETYAGECRDQVAVDAVMGHSDASMAANYRHGISDERLRDCVNTVRDWLFNEPESK